MAVTTIRGWFLLPILALIAGIGFTASVALAGPGASPPTARSAAPVLATNPQITPVPIPDLGTATATLDVTTPGTITTIDVINLTISHTMPSDLNVVLISPHGTHVTLFSNTCGGDDWK